MYGLEGVLDSERARRRRRRRRTVFKRGPRLKAGSTILNSVHCVPQCEITTSSEAQVLDIEQIRSPGRTSRVAAPSGSNPSGVRELFSHAYLRSSNHFGHFGDV